MKSTLLTLALAFAAAAAAQAPPPDQATHQAQMMSDLSTLLDLTEAQKPQVQAILQDVKPTEALAVPRAAVLADQQGDYVFVVGKDNKVEKRPVKLGQSTPALAAVLSGLSEGETVVVDGIQRVRPGLTVSPGPAAQQVQPPAGATPQAAKP